MFEKGHLWRYRSPWRVVFVLVMCENIGYQLTGQSTPVIVSLTCWYIINKRGDRNAVMSRGKTTFKRDKIKLRKSKMNVEQRQGIPSCGVKDNGAIGPLLPFYAPGVHQFHPTDKALASYSARNNAHSSLWG